MNGQPFGAQNMPTMPGQDAFGTIQEIVQILDADPATDWSKVNIAALREHLIDMNEVTLHAAAAQHIVGNSLVIDVTGEGRTRDAIKRMVPAHVHELRNLGWNAKTEDAAGRRDADGDRRRRATTDPAQGARFHRHHGARRPPPAASSDDGEGRVPDALSASAGRMTRDSTD